MLGKPLFCGAVGLFAVACAPRPASTAIAPRASVKPEAKDPMPNPDPAEAMRGLRLRALNWSAQDLGIAPSAEFPHVYGVLMEWPLGKATATVTSFASGDASLYTTTGFGVIGGVDHERVRAAARRFVSAAERDYDAATPTAEFPYPAEGRVRFVLMGDKGRRAFEGEIPAPGGSGRLYDLFAAGQDVLTQLRRIVQAAGH